MSLAVYKGNILGAFIVSVGLLGCRKIEAEFRAKDPWECHVNSRVLGDSRHGHRFFQ